MKATTDKRNITIELDAASLQNAKMLAARRSVSVSQLLRDQLALLANQDNSYELAKQRALAAFPKVNSSGRAFQPYPSRESIHER